MTLWHRLQGTMAPEANQVQQTQNCTQSSARPTVGFPEAAAASPAPAGSQMVGHVQDRSSSSSEHCCCYTAFSQTCPGEQHTMEFLTHLLATGRTCCRATITKLQIKPQARWKDVRKGHLILFLLKREVSSWFFTRYGNLVTLQGKHK